MQVGQRVRARREMLGLSQRELSALSGVKQPLISAIESGRRQPTPETATALERALAIRPSLAVRQRRGEILDVLRGHGVREPRVFGSVARGTDTPASDLDLLVTFPPQADITELLALQDELAELLTVAVDILSAGSSGPVAERAAAEAVPL